MRENYLKHQWELTRRKRRRRGFEAKGTRGAENWRWEPYGVFKKPQVVQTGFAVWPCAAFKELDLFLRVLGGSLKDCKQVG